MIGCRLCAGHPLGTFAVGDRVVLTSSAPRADGLHPGTRGVVVGYSVAAGAKRQEVRVRRKGGRVAAFAPCELRSEGTPASPGMLDYKAITREEFARRMRDRRVVVRMVAA